MGRGAGGGAPRLSIVVKHSDPGYDEHSNPIIIIKDEILKDAVETTTIHHIVFLSIACP